LSGEEEAVVARDASGDVTGFGSIVPSAHELRGLYVTPERGQSGIGGDDPARTPGQSPEVRPRRTPRGLVLQCRGVLPTSWV
jgi:hypothetical protein